MPRYKRKTSSTNLYHVFIKGINHERIFNQSKEKNYFKRILIKHISQFNVEFHAYCIMSNHAHFLIRADNLNTLSHFMSKILAEYALYYNYKHNRNGHVFQNRFRSECIETTDYYWNCIRYIHMNPVKAHMVTIPLDYKYSSMHEFKSKKPRILHENALKSHIVHFRNWESFELFHSRGCKLVFVDTKHEIYQQQKTAFYECLVEFSKRLDIEDLSRIFEERSLRIQFENFIKQSLNLSNSKYQSLYKDFKKEIMI